MPKRGISLVGFMEQPHAVNYMRANCVMPDPSDAALIAEWNAAKANLGPPLDDVGHPDIQDIPPPAQQYIQQLWQQPWVQQGLAVYPNAAFKVVEIDPLLAYQFHILTDHSEGHCGGLPLGPGIVDLLPIFLPQAPPHADIRMSGQQQSMLLATDSLNVRIKAAGLIGPNSAGIVFDISLPFVHVVRFNGRCYLINGFHRTLGARTRGAGRMPCLFRDVASADEIGIRPDGSTFSLALLESTNPPTLRHFAQGRAHQVPIRQALRVLQINWSEHALPME
jgi:hypothetical protein